MYIRGQRIKWMTCFGIHDNILCVKVSHLFQVNWKYFTVIIRNVLENWHILGVWIIEMMKWLMVEWCATLVMSSKHGNIAWCHIRQSNHCPAIDPHDELHHKRWNSPTNKIYTILDDFQCWYKKMTSNASPTKRWGLILCEKG